MGNRLTKGRIVTIAAIAAIVLGLWFVVPYFRVSPETRANMELMKQLRANQTVKETRARDTLGYTPVRQHAAINAASETQREWFYSLLSQDELDRLSEYMEEQMDELVTSSIIRLEAANEEAEDRIRNRMRALERELMDLNRRLAVHQAIDPTSLSESAYRQYLVDNAELGNEAMEISIEYDSLRNVLRRAGR